MEDRMEEKGNGTRARTRFGIPASALDRSPVCVSWPPANFKPPPGVATARVLKPGGVQAVNRSGRKPSFCRLPRPS
jgi:hypothetical protein